MKRLFTLLFAISCVLTACGTTQQEEIDNFEASVITYAETYTVANENVILPDGTTTYAFSSVQYVWEPDSDTITCIIDRSTNYVGVGADIKYRPDFNIPQFKYDEYVKHVNGPVTFYTDEDEGEEIIVTDTEDSIEVVYRHNGMEQTWIKQR